jgi:hypothetical protein
MPDHLKRLSAAKLGSLRINFPARVLDCDPFFHRYFFRHRFFLSWLFVATPHRY